MYLKIEYYFPLFVRNHGFLERSKAYWSKTEVRWRRPLHCLSCTNIILHKKKCFVAIEGNIALAKCVTASEIFEIATDQTPTNTITAKQEQETTKICSR